MTKGPRILAAAPLSQETFSAFGDVVSHRGTEQRHYLARPCEQSAEAKRAMVWVSRQSKPRHLPLSIERMERHPYSAQTFIPLKVSRYLVIVAPNGPDDRPDATGARAFIAQRGQGVCYGRGVWHHGLTVLDEPAEFVTLMSMRGEGDDEFVDLPEPLQVDAAGEMTGALA